jgi:glycosyltransferase involved in cell wall biosynthesis
LRSALDQEEVAVEVIVVDDGSRDDTRAVLSSVDDGRLVVIKNEQPIGVARARNAAIEMARGEWIAFLDDDDLWAPEKLRLQLRRSREGGLAICFSTVIYLGEGDSIRHITHPPDEADIARALLTENIMGGPSGILIRADVLKQLGGFDERLSALADWDMWIRATGIGTAGYCDEPLVAYRHHDQNMTQAEATEIMDQFALLREKHGQKAKNAGVELGGGWRRRWEAAQALSSGRRLRAARGYLASAVSTRSPRDVLRAIGALGGERLQRLGRRAEDRTIRRPEWLDRYA